MNSSSHRSELEVNSDPIFQLGLFGSPRITGAGGVPLTGRVTQRHRIALLSLLALSPGARRSRDKLMAYLWPESDAEHARTLLNQAVYVVRRALGDAAVVSTGDELQLNALVVETDVSDFASARARGDHARMVELYRGPLLDGFFLDDAPEFGDWLERERQRLAAEHARAVDALAEEAEAEADYPRAVEWWRERVALDPYDSRVALRLMEALAACGNRAGALQEAAAHQRLLRAEFGIEPPPEVLALSARLREGPSPGSVGGSRVREPTSPGPLPEAPAASAAAPKREAVAREAPASRWQRGRVRLGVAALALGAVVLGALQVLPAGRAPAAPVAAASSDPARQRTQNIAAYELFLRGNDPVLLRSDSGALQMLEYFQRAVELDSTFADAYAGLATAYMRIRPNGREGRSFHDLQALAEAAALRALALDDSLVTAHRVYGTLRLRDWDPAAAEAHFKHALALDPNQALTHEGLVQVYLQTGRVEEALAHAERGVEIDPLSPRASAELARALLANGRCDEALARLERIVDVQPPLLRVAGIAAQCHAIQGRWEEAIAAIRPQAATQPGAQGFLGYLLASAGRREEARDLLARLRDRWQSTNDGAVFVAMVHAGLGELDEAFVWLDRAIQDRSITPLWGFGLVLEPIFAELHRDPRFQRVREALGG